MSAALVAILALQGLAFLCWAGLMFVTLFQLRAQITRRYGPGLFSLGNTLRGFRDFLRDPYWARRRLWLGLLTLALFALIGVQVVVSGQAMG